MLYVFAILFYICSFAFSELCNDPIINDLNIDQEFMIDNVRGIGEVAVPSEFKHIIKSTLMRNIASGRFIHDEFEEYVRDKIDGITKFLTHKLECLIHSNNKNIDKLIFFNELIYAIYDI